MGLLKSTKRTLGDLEREREAKENSIMEEMTKDSYVDLLKKVNDGVANMRELFALTDMEGGTFIFC
jgi:hypothetical protein